MKKILLIGCGEYAMAHHVPVLLDYQQNREIEVSAVLIDKNHIDYTKQELDGIGLQTHVDGIGYNIDNNNIQSVIEKTVKKLQNLIEQYEPDGAIVTPIPVFNFEITKVCLKKELHVLVEKPATCPPNCCWDKEAANSIFPQLEKLVSLAREKQVRLLVGAQRRYEKIYQWVANECGPPEVIKAVHARGWGKEGARIPMNEYRRWRRYPYLTGGKIMLSGYHVLDIVVWWIKKNIGKEATSARVFSSFDRHTYTEFIQNGENHNTEKTATIQIQFFEDQNFRKPSCLTSFLFTTSGPKNWTRETYFITNRDQERFTIERDHSRSVYMLPTISERREGIEKIVTISDAAGGNKEPTKDFIHGILNDGEPLYGHEISSGDDHLNSAKLIQAIYLSAIKGEPKDVELL